MTRLEILQGLQSRIAEAKGPTSAQAAHEWAAALYPRDHDSNELLILALAGDISALGAVVALIEREMPVYSWLLGSGPSGSQAQLTWWPNGLSDRAEFRAIGQAPTPTLALLASFIDALITKEQAHAD